MGHYIESYSGRLLMFDGLSGTFRTIKLRGRNPSCVVCGDTPSITQLIDYELFCGSSANDKVGVVYSVPIIIGIVCRNVECLSSTRMIE